MDTNAAPETQEFTADVLGGSTGRIQRLYTQLLQFWAWGV
jgi:hypothetical protein